MEKIGKKRSVIADESEKTKKAREKMQRQYNEIGGKITPEALRKKSEEIHDWIARHSELRQALKDRNHITLFDKNQNSASLSKRIVALTQELSQNLKIFS